ncbi:MAG: nitrogen fixation protein NifE [Euryarchaeota archaeon]|nr:nitrogen fixation protein NifE [Euryarchaeota archaeon]
MKYLCHINQTRYMEPQRTCKLFGAVRAVLGIKDALPLIHGPLGCSYHIRYLLSVRSNKPVKILTTGMNQTDVVFGAEDKLENAIFRVDKEYSPNLIVVLTSCASSIIGEDIGRVIKKIRNNIKPEIININAGGFEGTQIDGYEESLCALIDLMYKSEFKKDAVNLVSQFRGGPDLGNLKDDFGKLKIDINCVLTSNSTLEMIKNAGQASLNVSMCEASGILPCKVMQDKLDIPFLNEIAPIGVSSSSSFFRKICDFFNVKYKLKDDEVNARSKIEKYSEYLKGKKVAIVAGSTRAIALTDFVSELGMKPLLVSLDFEGRNTINTLEEIIKKNGINPVILKEPEYYDIYKYIKELMPDLILGGLGEIGISREMNIPLFDVMHAQEITMGFRGAVELIKNIKKILADQ